MVDEMSRQNRPYVFLTFRTAGDCRVLLLVNSGNRVAGKIVMEVISDAKIYVTLLEEEGISADDVKVSSLALCKQGISSLPPSGEIELGFIELRKPKLTPQLLKYKIRYVDGSIRTYDECLSLEYYW